MASRNHAHDHSIDEAQKEQPAAFKVEYVRKTGATVLYEPSAAVEPVVE
jgi:hypothetical protein